MAFKGKTVFIPGGCGTVGAGITRSLLQHGARVAVASRAQERLDGLRDSVDKTLQSNLILIKEDVSSEDGAKKALETLQKQGGLQHVIASMGSWWHGGPLTKQPIEEYDKALHERARSHFICAKVFLPYLANVEGSSYTILTGAALENFVLADISLILVASGCLFGISEALRAEFKDSKVLVNEVRIGFFIQPKLDKDLEKKTIELEGKVLDTVGNDVFADFMISVLKSRPTGIVKVFERKDMEKRKKEF